MRPRDEKGRFVRADKPVLHRQLPEPDAYTAEWLQRTAPQPINHGPRIEVRTLVLALLVIAIVAAAFMGLAWLSGGGVGQ